MPAGLLKYSDTHDSIIYKSNLKSLSSVTSPEVGSGTFGTGATTEFDSELGMTSGANGGVSLQDIVGYGELARAGQISIDVDTSYIAYADYPSGLGQSGSSGDLLSDGSDLLKYLVQWGNGTNRWGQIALNYTNTTGTGIKDLRLAMIYADQVQQIKVSSLGKDSKTRLTASWIGAKGVLFIDGKPVKRLEVSYAVTPNNRTIPNVDELFKNIHIGSYRTGTTGAAVGCYFSNILVSNQPVTLPESQGLGTIALFGHSFVMSYGQYDKADDVALLDCPLAAQIEKHLINNSVYCKEMVFAGVAGGGASDAVTPKLSDYIARNGSSNLLDYNPDTVVILMGTNDLAQYLTVDASAFTFEAEIKNRIDEICTGSGSENIKKIVLCLINTLGAGDSQYDTAAFVAARAAYNASLKLMPAYAVASGYPVIKIVDTDAALGGENPAYPTYFGQIQRDTNRTIHLTGLGNDLTAKAIVTKLLEF